MRGEEEGKERKLGEVKGWDVGRPYVLGPVFEKTFFTFFSNSKKT